MKAAVDSMMADFSIADYLLGNSYSYLEAMNVEEELGNLVAVGQPTYRNQAQHANPAVRILILNLNGERVGEWDSKIMPLFPPKPTIVKAVDPTSMIILTIQPIKEHC